MWNETGHGGNWGSGGWVVMVIMMAVFVLAVAWVVTTMVRHGGATGVGAMPPAATQESPARSVLDERFARGEIDDDEYRRRRALLTEGR